MLAWAWLKNSRPYLCHDDVVVDPIVNSDVTFAIGSQQCDEFDASNRFALLAQPDTSAGSIHVNSS